MDEWKQKGALPQNDRRYLFDSSQLDSLSTETKLEIWMEHIMALGDASHCKKLWPGTAESLRAQLGEWLENGEFTEKSFGKIERFPNLKPWAERLRKFLRKQEVKNSHCGVNIAGLGRNPNPKEIRALVDAHLKQDGAVRAMDPWWKKESWEIDQTVTVYLKKEDAIRLVKENEENPLTRGDGVELRVWHHWKSPLRPQTERPAESEWDACE